MIRLINNLLPLISLFTLLPAMITCTTTYNNDTSQDYHLNINEDADFDEIYNITYGYNNFNFSDNRKEVHLKMDNVTGNYPFICRLYVSITSAYFSNF